MNFRDKIRTTKKTLLSTGVSEDKVKNMITVFNKIDIFGDRKFKNTKSRVYLSALNGVGVEEFRDILSSSY